jgi:hypothetical protein
MTNLMPFPTYLTRSTAWLNRALCSLAVIVAIVVLSACQAAPAPAPTPQCVRPTLTLGSTQFPIETLARAADGSLALPADKPGAAFWIEGTSVNYVFALNPTANNAALKDALKSGDTAKIVWADCGADEYVVKSVEAGLPEQSVLYDQSHGGLTVFVPGGSSGGALTITGARPQAAAVETPGPGEAPTETNEVQADLSFLGNTTSPDGKSVQITLTITNTGSAAISLTANDLSLTAENAAPLAPTSVEPSLPQTIPPGAGATFAITFPHPGANIAVLKILTISLDYYF